MDFSVLRSYLVKLGFQVDQPAVAKFEQVLRDISYRAELATGNISKNFAKASVAVVGALTSIGLSTVALMDSVAQADLGYQMFARRMMMSTEAARRLKIATDALGYSLEDIIWGPPELRERYRQLTADQRRMTAGLGGGEDFETQMRRIRDIRFEFTRLRVELQYFSMGLVKNLSKLLFGDEDTLLRKLREFNDWFQGAMPRITQTLARDLVPILKDLWATAKNVAEVLGYFASAFLNLLGALYGDQRLEGTALTMKRVAAAAQDLAQSIRKISEAIREYKRDIGIGITTGLGAAGGFAVGGPLGALLGGALGFGAGAYMTRPTAGQEGAPNAAAQARYEAERVAAMTGRRADLIYGQWMHETGGFTSPLFNRSFNLAGMKNPGGQGYQSFGSMSEAADAYARLLMSPRYAGTLGANTPEQFAAGLKAGGWYEDNPRNYTAGLARGAGQYNGGNVYVGNITVQAPPGADANQHARAVHDELARLQRGQLTRNLMTPQTAGPYN